ncbi:MAG: hypothetical protein WAP03_15835 [Methylorubrum rhodinum]
MIVFELNNQQIALLALLLMTVISLALGLAITPNGAVTDGCGTSYA